MAAAAPSSSSSALPHGEAMASPTPYRYKQGSRVLMVTNWREKGKQRWVKADVYRIEEGSGRTALHLREVGGHREEFKVLVPHSKTKTSPHGQQAHGGFRLTHKNSADQEDNTMAPCGLGDDHLSFVFSFMTPRELSALPTLLKQWPQVRKGAFHQQTHIAIAIDSSTEEDRHFWESMTPEAAFELGRRLVNLTAVSLVQPFFDQSWRLGTMISVVEGHAAGRREACKKEGQQHMAKGSLETIDFTTSTTTTSSTTNLSSLPAPLTEPSTLHALSAVTGAFGEHSELVNRGWKMPALQCVELWGWGADVLGRFISSSSSLKQVRGCRRSWEWWAAVFERFPVASAGQPGPLRHLQTIGGIEHDRHGDVTHGGSTRLQDVLTSRGCRKSLTGLDVKIPQFQYMYHTSLSALLAVDGFINTCCISPEVPLNVTIEGNIFNLAVFYADAFPPCPSPFIKTAIKEAARQAEHVGYAISQHDLTHPIDTPSQAAVEIAQSLSFDKVRVVEVHDDHGFVPPLGTIPPAPDIINHLQPFSRAGQLYLNSRLGVAAFRLLAQKMPMEVESVLFDARVSALSAQDRSGVLEGLGEKRVDLKKPINLDRNRDGTIDISVNDREGSDARTSWLAVLDRLRRTVQIRTGASTHSASPQERDWGGAVRMSGESDADRQSQRSVVDTTSMMQSVSRQTNERGPQTKKQRTNDPDYGAAPPFMRIQRGLSTLFTAGVRGLRRVVLSLEGVYRDRRRGDAIREVLPNSMRGGGFTINTLDHPPRDPRDIVVEATYEDQYNDPAAPQKVDTATVSAAALEPVLTTCRAMNLPHTQSLKLHK
ncbi:unnamed protein product [Vitrella brassicaformis CCMP3155]|uniref:Uncharacterized protein n=2 Tax=Vitrella brassicaformis TaxID=1169539 RepID=A0A0G4GQ92_VITBC|nr:unnamed protein product [Vitrella brassicaformis CCMP3155]|eukprot:CEM32625.1 unnamed protein product [Vitrella brassicaformis CCMP3155]